MEIVVLIGWLLVGSLLLTGLSWKWTLPAKKSAVLIVISLLVASLLAVLLRFSQFGSLIEGIAVGTCQLTVYLTVLAWLFYRDPERDVPQTPNLLLSPADGEVIYIRKINPGKVPIAEKKGKLLMLEEIEQSALGQQELCQIGISMVFTDVHVNRAPMAGKVLLLKHRTGKFLSLRDEDAVGVNERQTIIIENPRLQVGIVQIASRLVRRIVAYVSEGETIPVGKRIGMIKFGSQVDIFIPVTKVSALKVKVGDCLIAGVTPITTILPH